jgi:GMP synthase-like glutamine amidotransferase
MRTVAVLAMSSILIIQNHPVETPGAIIGSLHTRGQSFQLMKAWEGEPFPSVADIDAVICLGCPKGIRDIMTTPWLKQLFHYVAECVRYNKPYLGICFGGQLLAHVLGATVTANRVKELGVYSVSLTEEGKKDAIFRHFPIEFPVFHWHGDTFAIPFGATFLAEGFDCKNQAFRRGRQIGVQFHLESESRDVIAWSDEYTGDLVGFHKSADDIRTDFENLKSGILRLNDTMIANFVEEAAGL